MRRQPVTNAVSAIAGIKAKAVISYVPKKSHSKCAITNEKIPLIIEISKKCADYFNAPAISKCANESYDNSSNNWWNMKAQSAKVRVVVRLKEKS